MSKYFPTFKKIFEKILKKSLKFKKFFKVVFIIIILIAALAIVKDEIEYQFGIGFWAEEGGYEDQFMEKYSDEFYEEDYKLWPEGCNVSGIILRGELVTYISNESYDEEGYAIIGQTASEDIVYYIQEAEKDDNIKAILIEIDSYGGYTVASEEIANALKRASKPTVALVRTAAASAAYYAATGADIIFASQDSDIGSIGVSMSYLDYAKQNQLEGINYNQLSSGKFKDAGDWDKALTNEEKELFMRDIKIMHENFIQAVVKNRGMDINKVRALADGSTMLGKMALENGLIDRIGGMYEIKEYLKEMIGEEVEVCW